MKQTLRAPDSVSPCSPAALGALAAAALRRGARRRPVSVPCWKRLLNDWYDGTINNIYPIPCYSAGDQAPAAGDDDLRQREGRHPSGAEQAAINHQSAPPEQGGGNGTTTIGGSGSDETPPSTSTHDRDDHRHERQTTTTTAVVIVPTPTSTPKKKKHGISGALADITPGRPAGVPAAAPDPRRARDPARDRRRRRDALAALAPARRASAGGLESPANCGFPGLERPQGPAGRIARPTASLGCGSPLFGGAPAS